VVGCSWTLAVFPEDKCGPSSSFTPSLLVEVDSLDGPARGLFEEDDDDKTEGSLEGDSVLPGSSSVDFVTLPTPSSSSSPLVVEGDTLVDLKPNGFEGLVTDSWDNVDDLGRWSGLI
jgi:hypothetical protein